MDTESTKTVIKYVLSYGGTDTSTIDFTLEFTHGDKVEIITQDAYNPQKLYVAHLYAYSPSLRNIEVDINTTFSVYVKDHSYILGGGICQIGWSSSQKRMELFTLCSSHLELIEIDKLPWTREEEQSELAKNFAYDRLVLHNLGHKYLFLGADEPVYTRVELVSTEEVSVDFMGANMGRGYNREVPERTWIMTFLCYSEEETNNLKCYVLVDYYRKFPYFVGYRLIERNGVFTVGKPFL